MPWFLFALAGPALWAVSNHIDKYLLEKYFKGGGVGALFIFSSLFFVLILPVIFIFAPYVIHVLPAHALLLIGGGIIDVLAVLIYLYALRKDEASFVVPIFQTIPVFTYILAYLILGETLTPLQLTGGLIVIISAIGISLNLSDGKVRFKTNIFFLMLLSSILLGLNATIFKFVAINSNYWTSTFWSLSGGLFIGLFFLVFVRNYRKSFVDLMRTNRLRILGLNAVNEIIGDSASLLFRYGTLLAPVALVQSVNGLQPFFVFFYGIMLTLFFPHLGSESLLRKHLIQKVIAIVFMFIGAYIINL